MKYLYNQTYKHIRAHVKTNTHMHVVNQTVTMYTGIVLTHNLNFQFRSQAELFIDVIVT